MISHWIQEEIRLLKQPRLCDQGFGVFASLEGKVVHRVITSFVMARIYARILISPAFFVREAALNSSSGK